MFLFKTVKRCKFRGSLGEGQEDGEEGSCFDGSTWGEKEVSLGGVPQGLGTEVLMGKLTLGE